MGLNDNAIMIVVGRGGRNVPVARNRRAKLSLQFLNLVPIQCPKVRVIVQSMPSFDRRDLPFEIDTRREIQQLLDDGAAGRPGGVEVWWIGRSRHQGRRGHHHVVGWVGGGRVLVREVRHAWVFEREDEVDGRSDGVDEGGEFGAGLLGA